MARIAPRRAPNRYVGIIERIFAEKFTPGAATVPFARDDIRRVAKALPASPGRGDME